jgi:hypothetical protein
MRRVLLVALPVLALLLAACGGEEARRAQAPAPKPLDGPLSGPEQPVALRRAQTDLLLALQGVAGALGADPDLERTPAERCPDADGLVSSGYAQRLPVADGRAALDAAARHLETARWRVRRTPVAVLGTRDGASASLVLDAGGRTARLSGGTPCLPGTPEG